MGVVARLPRRVVRLVPGTNPPETALAEYYELPWNNPKAPVQGFSPRGMDIDRNGVVWVALASGHLGELRPAQVQGPAERSQGDRPALSRRMDVLHGAAAADQGRDGSRQRRGELLHVGGPVRHVRARRERADQHRQPSEGLLALKDGKWVVLRVPYPMGFYTKWLDGRIDDANAGWKGRGLWATVSTRAPFHMEGGKGTTSKVMKFQLRPDPLAR